MSPRSSVPAGPACLDELLLLLRRARLLDEAQWQRLAAGWPADLSAGEGVRRLVEAGLLTAFQGEQVLAGRVRRLRLGPYRLLARLGGGRGLVYLAEHVLMKRLVTLKVLGRARRRRLVESSTSTPAERARVTSAAGRRDEVILAAGLSHPNLVSALHAARLRGRLVLVLEYVRGIDLEELVNQTGRLPIALVCEVARQAAQALVYLHQRGLVHRDIKPANLILSHTSADDRPIVKLIDLGLACRVGADSDELCGTMDYLPPERGMGEPADGRGDLYSLGCTLYHLLAGQVPFPGGNWCGKLVRHRLEKPVPLTSLRPDVSAGLADLVARLMARDPAARPADPQALLDALDRLLLPVPVARPVRPPVRRTRPAKRRRPSGLVVSLLVGALLGGATLGALARLAWPPATAGTRARRAFVTLAGQEGPFPDLEKAIRAAPDGATLVLSGRGPHRLRPASWRGKSLTLRGEGKDRPRIERIDGAGLAWEALLAVEGDLTLEGLELSGGAGADRVAPAVTVSHGSLVLRDCRITGATGGPLVALRCGRALRLERCEIDAHAQGLAVEQAPGRAVDLTLTHTRVRVREVTGAAVLVWSPEAAPAPPGTVVLRRCRVEAGRALACRSLGGKLHVRSEGCHFVFHQALLSLDACTEQHRWTSRLIWRETGNEYRTNGAWIRLDGQPAVWDEASWRRLWRAGP